MARARCSPSCTTTATSWSNWCWPRAPVPEELVHRVLRDATVHRLIVPVLCGSALDYHRHPAAAGCGDAIICPARPTCRRSKASIPRSDKNARIRKPDVDEPFCGLVFKIQADKHGDLHYVRDLLGHAEGQHPGLQSRQGQEGKRQPALAHPGRPPRAGPSGRGGRYRGHHRPAAIDHRRHALRRQRADPAGDRSTFPRRSSRWPSSPKARPSARSWPKRWK